MGNAKGTSNEYTEGLKAGRRGGCTGGTGMKTIQVCTNCGSSNVMRDAWVAVNDSTDVRTFDDTYCCYVASKIGYEIQTPKELMMYGHS
jgi:hypothetical protein